MINFVLAAIIQLTGVTGGELRSRAFFDANNVKVGDPLILTIDFIGEADFRDLHPPALSRFLNRKDWKLDDKSAKTDTYQDARRLTYRIRPRREGVLYFPALEFGYFDVNGEAQIVRANEIPVHARAGADVVVEGMDEESDGMPKPPELARETATKLGEDEEFRWRKALANPTASAFAEFDFPEAKLNTATMYVAEGNWSKAMDVYSRLEWEIGQTPEIERGIVAALALKYESPNAELPIWRQVLRPVLKHAWRGRVLVVAGILLALAFLGFALNFAIRKFAVLAFAICLPFVGSAQGFFQQFNFGFGEKREPVKVFAEASISKPSPQVGEEFDFIIALEYPKTASVGEIAVTPSENFGLSYTGAAKPLADGESANVSNVVKRLAFPVRYDVPFKGLVSFTVNGMVSGRESRGNAHSRFSISFSNSFSATTKPIPVEVIPLDLAGQPEDFGGVVSEGLRIHEECDLMTVSTNDVITITYKLYPKGYVPASFLPEGAAYEWFRQNDRYGHATMIEYRGYFVARGEKETPKRSISYYDPRDKKYKRVTVGGTPIKYAP